MISLRYFQSAAVAVLFAGVVAGQAIPTGTLTGTVTDGTAPLPGVAVSVTSPNQQGGRVAYSTVNGDYILGQLPPGPYVVRFDLQGFQTVETTVKISGNLTSSVEAVMPRVTTVAEEVKVTGRYDTISTTAAVATAYESKLIQLLPVNRDVSSYVDLTPATMQVSGAPWYQTQIAGAPASENLNLINGVTANDNYMGYLLPLFIEDAIQETTTSLSSVSAEYGRFTGGVVNALTKSGGNEFHGSLRLNLTNPKWTAPTPMPIERTDKLDTLWEGTLGGYVLKDKLWLFVGGRTASTTTSLQTFSPVSIPYDQTTRQDRYEGKLTFALSPSHRLIASYLDVEESRGNYTEQLVYDLVSLDTMKAPESIAVLNYSGVLSNTLFLEAQYSARKKAYTGGDYSYTDIERGTPVSDMLNYGAWYNSPFGCAACPDPDDQRDNNDAFAKVSVFLSTEKAGSHDLRFGVDLYDDMWKINGWWSGSGYLLYAGAVNIVGTGTGAKYYPMILPGESFVEYLPIFELSQGTHFKTNSAFVNDVWRLSNTFSFNIGVRYDSNDGTDASGTKVVKDSKWSPRLSVTWDPKGNGATQVTLSYGEYVAAIRNSPANKQATGGVATDIVLYYDGPPINAEGNEVETHEALRQVFAWLEAIGGPMANPQLWAWAYAPGYQTFIGDNLRSPSTTAWTAGVSRRLGTRGFIRLDYVNKVWADFYSQRVDMTTGQSEDPFGNVYDRAIIENDNMFAQRKYWGLLLQGTYRFGDRLLLGGNYTYSKLYGRDPSVVVARVVDFMVYPEYRDLSWYAPIQYLAGDHRHRLNLYASWDAISTRAFAWNLSLLQQYESGGPYGAGAFWVPVSPYVSNPGYVLPPEVTFYNFTSPDAYRVDAYNLTNLAMTFTFKFAGVELYLNPLVTNLFNNQAEWPDMTVYTAFDQDYLNWFDPFTETPKECPQGTTCDLADGCNWQKGPNFGKPIDWSSYQTPRTFLLNVGLRF